MADKTIGELVEAKQITALDLFLLEQDGTAKNLKGQVLLNWLTAAADGHGGIHSIEKVGSNGLVDTYRMTFADTSTFDYIITNGRSIKTIAKTKTSGLTDTYTVTFDDGTTFTYTVTNGAKGDKGDAWYVWFKYASQMPTEESHSMGDVIDNCMGIYSGTQPTKPTDWKAYQWFQIKGEKGNTGDPAILLGWKTEYQASTSGKVPPSGAWSEELPAIQQGTYLWTRTTQTYNSGSPVVAYSVGYLGKDGTVTFDELTEEQKDEIRGGYYSPVISQPDPNTMQVVFESSKDGMPTVEPVNVTLPAGPNGKDYILTDTDRETIAAIARKNVPTPTEAGDAAPKSYVDTLGLMTATHTKSGTVHTLTAPSGCGNLKFTATAPYEDGDTIKLNGQAMTAKTQDGEPLSGGAWAAGAVVMCFVADNVLYFTGGGSTKVKLTIQLTANDGKSLAGQTVTVTEPRTGQEIDSFLYSGQPATLELPAGTTYKVTVSKKMGYTPPETAMGVLIDDTTVVISFQTIRRFGYRRAKADSNPDSRITYLYEAVGKQPMSVNRSTNAPVWGDWKDFVYEVACPVMLNTDGTEAYELNREDQTKKSDGTPSDISSTSFAGNAMVRFGGKWKWVKRYEDASHEYVIFADGQYDDTYHAYAHTNAEGQIADRFYWGMFKGGNVSNKLRSIADLSVMVSQTRNTEVAYAQANGEGYDTIYNSGWQYITDLLCLISKSDNAQEKFGSGRSKTSDTSGIATGSLKAHGPFWGSSDETSDVKVFWIEGFWGNTWESMRGMVNSNGKIKVKMVPPYNFDGAGYIDTGKTPGGTSGGFINIGSMTNETGFVPAAASGSGTTYYCDGMWFNNEVVAYANVGGSWTDVLKCGPRYVLLSREASYTYVTFGSRLSFIPPLPHSG